MTSFIPYISDHDVAMARTLLDEGLGLTAILEQLQEQAQESPSSFTKAVENEDLQTMCDLLKSDLDINQADSTGRTALHLAAERGDMMAACLLLAFGASFDKKADFNITPLHLAVRNGHERIAKVLVDAGAKPVDVFDFQDL